MIRTHWLGENVRTIDTTLDRLPALLPTFERFAFGRNRLRDVIARDASADAEALPVAVVSKKYVLVQHADAILAVTRQIVQSRIDAATVPARLLLTEYGTRMALRATLPAAHGFTPDDGHRMALTFECFNSVDGSVPLLAAVGWFRFVCSNGMVVGTPTAKVRQRHSPPLRIGEISEVLAEGMQVALDDRKSFVEWRALNVNPQRLAQFVDEPVARAWGPTAAARVYAIATTGHDGAPAARARTAPHNWPVVNGDPVPGSTPPCADAYQVAQVLAWVAAQRHNVAQRLEWRAQIRDLMSNLVGAA